MAALENAPGYATFLGSVTELLQDARRAAARSVNALMTATYWEIGRRIVEYEQRGEERAEYGATLIKRLSADLSARFGRGFSQRNLEQMRRFYLTYRQEVTHHPLPAETNDGDIPQTLSAESESAGNVPASRRKTQTMSAASRLIQLAGRFTHVDAGQMHLYLNYAAAHWTRADENPPVGLILCAQKDAALAHYALDNLPNKVLAAEYRTALPDEELLAAEIAETRRRLEHRDKKRGLQP